MFALAVDEALPSNRANPVEAEHNPVAAELESEPTA
jgi:hypothetical protein